MRNKMHQIFCRNLQILHFLGIKSEIYHSADVKVKVKFPENLILKISLRFWNCVGCGHMRGSRIVKITQSIFLSWSFSYIKLGELYWFHLNRRNFNPTIFNFCQFFIQNHISSVALCDDIGIKRWEILLRIFGLCEKDDVHLPQNLRKNSKMDFWF